jgi:hypothetical protein
MEIMLAGGSLSAAACSGDRINYAPDPLCFDASTTPSCVEQECTKRGENYDTPSNKCITRPDASGADAMARSDAIADAVADNMVGDVSVDASDASSDGADE